MDQVQEPRKLVPPQEVLDSIAATKEEYRKTVEAQNKKDPAVGPEDPAVGPQ